MKIDYDDFGGFELEAEDGRDRVWLKEMIENIPKEYKPFLSNFFRVDMERGCVSEEKFSDGSCIPMEDSDLEKVVTKEKDGTEFCWGSIEKIRFTPFGYYCKGVEERIRKAL